MPTWNWITCLMFLRTPRTEGGLILKSSFLPGLFDKKNTERMNPTDVIVKPYLLHAAGKCTRNCLFNSSFSYCSIFSQHFYFKRFSPPEIAFNIEETKAGTFIKAQLSARSIDRLTFSKSH